MRADTPAPVTVRFEAGLHSVPESVSNDGLVCTLASITLAPTLTSTATDDGATVCVVLEQRADDLTTPPPAWDSLLEIP